MINNRLATIGKIKTIAEHEGEYAEGSLTSTQILTGQNLNLRREILRQVLKVGSYVPTVVA